MEVDRRADHGWLNLARRLSKDYEVLPASSETFIRLTMISIMLARLANQA
jgi:transposase